MTIGVLLVRLRIPESRSLKDKRQVVRSITARLRNRFNVSVAEVDENDRWQTAAIGVAVVSNNARHANEVISHVIDHLTATCFEAEILDYETELVHAL